MASKSAVAWALATLHEAYPTREITEHTAKVWHDVLADISDSALVAATRALCREDGRRFFPTTGELFKWLTPPPAPVDIGKATRVIFSLGHYSPHAGQQPPSVEVVRNNLGDAMASAYAGVGGARLFSTNDTTREIAEREFGELLSEIPETQRALPAPRQFTFAAASRNGRLNGEPERIGDVLKQLTGAPPHD